MANPVKSLIGQTAIYGVSSILGRFVNFLLVPFYSYIFATNDFGIVTELTAYVTIFVVLFTYGMETAFFRFCQNEAYKRTTVYSTALSSLFVSSTLFILVFFLFGHKISTLIGYGDNSEFVLILGLTVSIDAFSSIPFARLRIENKAKRFAIVKSVNIFFNVFFNLFFLFFLPTLFGNNNWIYRVLYPSVHVGYIFISYLLTSIITLFLLWPELKSSLKSFQFDFGLLKSMLKYGFPVLLAGLAGMFSDSLDRILLKYLIVIPNDVLAHLASLNNDIALEAAKSKYVMSQVGIYGANVKIAVIMTLFLQAFRYAAEPFFFNYSKNSDSRLIYARVMKYFVAFSLFIFLGVNLFIDLVKFLIDKDYRSGLVVIPLLLLGKLFFGVVFNLSIWYKLKNKTQYGAYLAFIAAGSSIVLNFILIPVFGYLGAAWASVLSYFIMMVISFILEKRNFAIPYDYKSISIYFFIALLLYFINYFVNMWCEYYIYLNIIMLFAYIFIVIKNEKIDLHNLKTLILKK